MSALTMSGDDDKKLDAQLQDMKTQVDGFATDIKTMHERIDSTVDSANQRFDQLELA